MIQLQQKNTSKEPDFELRKIYRHHTGRLYILLGFGRLDHNSGGNPESLGEEQIILNDVITGDILIRPKDKFFDRHPNTGKLRYTPIEVINTKEIE